jgi:hypothetical protein
MEVVADFTADLAALWREELVRAGHPVPEGADPVAVGKMLFNLLHNNVESRPRRVHRSAELAAHRLTEGRSQALARFILACECGKDLGPFQSHRARDPHHNDGLLNDWGIRHFHLGAKKTKKGSRSQELLFARVDPDDVYLLEVLDHQDNESFNNIVLMEILRRNWPDLIEPYALMGFSAANEPVTSKSRRLLRESGIEPLLQLDGKLYIPLGGGIMGSGVSGRVMEEVLGRLHEARSHQHKALEMVDQVARQFEAETGRMPATIYVWLVPDEGGWKYGFSDEPMPTGTPTDDHLACPV